MTSRSLKRLRQSGLATKLIRCSNIGELKARPGMPERGL